LSLVGPVGKVLLQPYAFRRPRQQRPIEREVENRLVKMWSQLGYAALKCRQHWQRLGSRARPEIVRSRDQYVKLLGKDGRGWEAA
jgi:hypothetical protein